MLLWQPSASHRHRLAADIVTWTCSWVFKLTEMFDFRCSMMSFVVAAYMRDVASADEMRRESSEVRKFRADAKDFWILNFELIIRLWVLVLESENVKSLGSRILGPLSRSDFSERSKIRSESRIELYSKRKIEKTVATSMRDEIEIALVIFFFLLREILGSTPGLNKITKL